MKSLTILALLVAISAVLLHVGHTEETAELNDFEEEAFENVKTDSEGDEEQLVDSFLNPENDVTDDSENALESVNETPANNDDEPQIFKRTPGRRRRRRRRRRGLGRLKKIVKKIHKVLKKVCKLVKNSKNGTVKKVCTVVNILGDEESPELRNDDEIPVEQNEELLEESWLKEE